MKEKKKKRGVEKERRSGISVGHSRILTKTIS